jgi:predicted RNase H-like nuclease (RuvC/YqgF family)
MKFVKRNWLALVAVLVSIIALVRGGPEGPEGRTVPKSEVVRSLKKELKDDQKFKDSVRGEQGPKGDRGASATYSSRIHHLPRDVSRLRAEIADLKQENKDLRSQFESSSSLAEKVP